MAKPKAEIIKRPVERITSNVKRTAYSSIFESLALIILGILFVIFPDTIIKALSYIIGVFFIAKGAYNIAGFYLTKGQRDFFDDSILSGVISVLIGIAALLIGENIASVFRVIIGIIIIYESLVRINTAAKLYNIGINSWRYILALSIVMLVLGIFVTFNTGAVVTLIGWMMIITGIVGIIGDIMFIQHINTVIEYLKPRMQSQREESKK